MNTTAPESPTRDRTAWAWLVGTVLGIGYLRPGPGTWASAVTAIGWYFAARDLPQELQVGGALGIALLVTGIGIAAGTVVARESGRDDPSFVVIDEVAGQMITLLGAPLRWKCLIASFILFRVFDILKPPPVRRLESLPGGMGIMLDDVGAGLYALIVVQVLARLGVV